MNSRRGHGARFGCLMLLAACSSAGSPGQTGSGGSPSPNTGGHPGTGGQNQPVTGGNTSTGGMAPGSGGSLGTGGIPSTGGTSSTGGNPSPTGGAGGRGATGGGGGAGSGAAGALGTGGGAIGGGSGGAAGNAGQTGTAGRGGSAGMGGAGGVATSFVCNQVTAMTLTREWFEAGFEKNPGMVDGRWQLKAREHGYITEWANPTSDFWNEMIESPCTNGSTSPDHVILTVLSWVPDCCTTQAEWETQIVKAITNFKSKYAGLKRIDLMTVIRGPGNKLCPSAPVAGETIVIPPELDAALASSAAQFPGLAFVAPKFEGSNCAAFSGGGPHLTTAGNTAVAKTISAAFVNLQ